MELRYLRNEEVIIGVASKWLRVMSLSPNDKTRNHLVANAILIIKRIKK